VRIFPEGTQIWAEIRFVDKDGRPFVPGTARYKVDDYTTEAALLDWTDIPPTAKIDVSIPASANRILDDYNETERRVLTVQSDQGTEGQLAQEAHYKVTNLEGFV